MNLIAEFDTALVQIYSKISVCIKYNYFFIIAIGMAFMIMCRSFIYIPFKDICSSIEAGFNLFIEKQQFIIMI